MDTRTSTGILDAFSANVAVLASSGEIIAVNRNWSDFAVCNDLFDPDSLNCVGANYLDTCDQAGGEAMQVATGIRSVLGGISDRFLFDYTCHSPFEKRWFRLDVTPVMQDGGILAVAAHWNVTEREVSEKLNSDLAAIVESSRNAIIGKDLNGVITIWNAGAEQIFGYTSEEMIGQPIMRIIPARYRAQEESILASIRSGRVVPQLDTHRVHADGSELNVSITVSPIRNARGDIVGASKIIRDVTIERRALEALRASEYRYRQIVETSSDGIWTLGADGLTEFTNQRLRDMLGYEEHEMTRRPLSDFALPGEHPEPLVTPAECTFRCKDGTMLESTVVMTPLFDEHGGTLVMVTDIGERKRSQRHAIDAADRLGDAVDALRSIAMFGGSSSELIGFAAMECQRVCSADGALIGHVTASGVECRAASGLGEAARTMRMLDGPIMKQVLRSGTAYVSGNVELDPFTGLEGARVIGMRSMIATPLRSDAGITGVVCVFASGVDAFDATDLSNVQVMAESIDALWQKRVAMEALRASEVEYRMLFQQNPKPMWIHDLSTLRFLAVNHAAVLHFGWSEEEFLEMSIPDVRPAGDPLDRVIRDVTGYARHEPFRQVIKDGTTIWLELTADDIVFRGVDARLVAAGDVTMRVEADEEIKRVNRALRLLSRCHEVIAMAETEDDLLVPLCQAAVDIGGYRMAWVGSVVQDAECRIIPLAMAGHEEGYLSEISLTWPLTEMAEANGACAAIHRGTPISFHGADAGRGFASHENAIGRGYREAICFPLMDDGATFGILCFYSSQEHDTGVHEAALLTKLADAVAFGLIGLKTKAARTRLETAVLTVATGVTASTGLDFFESLVRSMAVAVDAPVAMIASYLPGEPLVARTIAVVIDGNVVGNFEYLVADAPGGQFDESGTCVHASNVPQSFPRSWTSPIGANAVVSSRLDDTSGHPVGVATVLFRDSLPDIDVITSTLKIFAVRAAAEVQRLEAHARISEQASLLDSARDAIIVRDLLHEVRYWNKGAQTMYGWSSEEAVGVGEDRLIYDDTSRFMTAMRELLETGEWAGELTQVDRAHEVMVVDTRWTLLPDAPGKPARILSIGTDVTARKKLEQQFLRAQRMESVGTLAGGIAHDLNNVLAPIMMSVELLREDVHDADALEMLDTVASCARRGADLVKQVLTFARGVDGLRVPVDVGKILDDVDKIARDTFPKNIEIRLSVQPRLASVIGDSTQIHQVLLNLCVNARDALPQGGHISITASEFDVDEHYAGMNIDAIVGRHVVISVHDNGTGIPPSILERIFDPFFTTKGLGLGTGLGLSTSLAIVKSHGGFIRVYSEPGSGTTFRVYMPAAGGPAPGREDEATPESPRGHGEHVLVVDDEEAIRRVTGQTLEAFGYQVTKASDGAEAIAIYAQHTPRIDIVLTDMMMPVMDGRALIAALTRINPGVRIIAASGAARNSTEERTNGVMHFLSKPYTAATLLTALRDALAN